MWSYFFFLSKNKQDIAIFLISNFKFSKLMTKNKKNTYNSLILAENEKIRPLCFLHL